MGLCKDEFKNLFNIGLIYDNKKNLLNKMIWNKLLKVILLILEILLIYKFNYYYKYIFI